MTVINHITKSYLQAKNTGNTYASPSWSSTFFAFAIVGKQSKETPKQNPIRLTPNTHHVNPTLVREQRVGYILVSYRIM